jgi:hypothetical protein
MSFGKVEHGFPLPCIPDLQVKIGVEYRFIIAIIQYLIEVFVDEWDMKSFKVIIAIQGPVRINHIILVPARGFLQAFQWQKPNPFIHPVDHLLKIKGGI